MKRSSFFGKQPSTCFQFKFEISNGSIMIGLSIPSFRIIFYDMNGVMMGCEFNVWRINQRNRFSHFIDEILNKNENKIK